MSEIIRVPTAEDIIGGQFVLRREIGRGGYGVVYEAVQLGIDRKVAVKMLLPRALEMQAKVIERFQREARLASNLKHPCAVTIYAFGVHQGASNEVELPFLAMELLDGESLQEHMNRLGARCRRSRWRSSWSRCWGRSRRRTARGSSTAT